MRTARQRRQQQLQFTKRPAAAPVAQQPAKAASKPAVATGRQAMREKKQEVKKMEEEHVSEEEYTSEDEVEVDPETERQELREEVAADSMDELRPNGKLYIAIRERYEELIKDIWQSQGQLEEFGFSDEEKDIINKRVKLWLEYFAVTAAFRDENVNLFEYIDTFTSTQTFI